MKVTLAVFFAGGMSEMAQSSYQHAIETITAVCGLLNNTQSQDPICFTAGDIAPGNHGRGGDNRMQILATLAALHHIKLQSGGLAGRSYVYSTTRQQLERLRRLVLSQETE